MRNAIAGLALFLCHFAPAHAQERSDNMHERGIFTRWTISTIDLLERDQRKIEDASENGDGDASLVDLSAGADEDLGRLVRDGEFVIKQRLLPPKAARLTSAIVDSDGDILAETGQELYGVVSGTGEVFCLAKAQEINPVGAILVGAVYQESCFKDVDGDGIFDGGFKKKSRTKYFPQLSGKHSRKLREIDGGSYEAIAPREMERVYFVGVEFHGRSLLGAGSSRKFSVTYGVSDEKFPLTKRFSTKGDAMPQTLTVAELGARFSVLGIEGNAIRTRVDEPFDEGPFAVSISVTIR